MTHPRPRRVGAPLVEQGLYAASNLLLSIGIALSSDAASLGAFAVTYAVVVVGVGIVKAGTAEVLLASVASTRNLDLRSEYRLALIGGMPVAGVVAIVGMASGLGTTSTVLLALAAPLVAVFEVTRARCVIEADLARSSVADIAWMLPVMVGMAVRGPLGSVEALIALWLAGCVSALLITTAAELHRARDVTPAPRRRDRRAFAAEFITSQMLGHVVIWLVGLTIGLTAAGQIRLAELATSPVTQILIALRWTGLATTRIATGADRARTATRLTLVGSGAAALLFLVALLLPTAWFNRIQSIDDPSLVRALVALMAVHRLGVAMSIGPSLLLRVGGQADRSARNRAMSAVVSLVATIPGLVAGSTSWLMLGLASSSVLTGIGWWWDLRRLPLTGAASDASDDEIREMTAT